MELNPPVEHGSQPATGWRAWRLHRTDGGELRIAPTTPRPDWVPGTAPAATCSGAHTRLYVFFNPELEATHRSPEPGCTCGYYAANGPARLARAGRTAAVIGTVSMWGRVIEHAKGWRARHMYPARLRLICPRCLWLGRFPGVPDRVVADGERLTPTCRDHARPARRDGITFDVDEVQAELLDVYKVEQLPVEALDVDVATADPVTRVLRVLDLWSR